MYVERNILNRLQTFFSTATGQTCQFSKLPYWINLKPVASIRAECIGLTTKYIWHVRLKDLSAIGIA